MAATYVSNITVNSGEDFNQTFTLESSDSSSPLNLTGYSVSSQMRKHAGSTTKTDFTAEALTPLTDGRIMISLTNTQTAALKSGRYVYDIIIEKDSTKTRVVGGMVLVKQGVTR
jgi:hypothetical protein|tara:strand:+ start:235 stop:576 length:342 start_codon:yes stop_codon:yes gene_type:complete